MAFYSEVGCCAVRTDVAPRAAGSHLNRLAASARYKLDLVATLLNSVYAVVTGTFARKLCKRTAVQDRGRP